MPELTPEFKPSVPAFKGESQGFDRVTGGFKPSLLPVEAEPAPEETGGKKKRKKIHPEDADAEGKRKKRRKKIGPDEEDDGIPKKRKKKIHGEGELPKSKKLKVTPGKKVILEHPIPLDEQKPTDSMSSDPFASLEGKGPLGEEVQSILNQEERPTSIFPKYRAEAQRLAPLGPAQKDDSTSPPRPVVPSLFSSPQMPVPVGKPMAPRPTISPWAVIKKPTGPLPSLRPAHAPEPRKAGEKPADEEDVPPVAQGPAWQAKPPKTARRHHDAGSDDAQPPTPLFKGRPEPAAAKITSTLNLGRRAEPPKEEPMSVDLPAVAHMVSKLKGGPAPEETPEKRKMAMKKSTFASDDSGIGKQGRSESKDMIPTEPELYLDRPPSRRRGQEKKRLAAREEAVKPRHRERPKHRKIHDAEDRRVKKNLMSDDDFN
jgi:hypothetical protein